MRMRLRLLTAVLAAAASTTTTATFGLAGPASAQSVQERRTAPPVVTTTTGAYRGIAVMPQVDGFLGLRYGASPSGERRWRPPVPAERVTVVQDAGTFGAACPNAEGEFGGPRTEAEDCLFLNVWRPARASRLDRLPVYVFVHGGALTSGSAAQVDMAEFVQRTGVIGVSMNYRLGALGFLALPGLSQESGESGNYGLQDQQLALRWVRSNISAFGGDPRRVTIGGESAGAWSVCAHLVSPGSDRLFSQAMLQSPPATCPTQTQQQAEARGSALAARLGCAAGPGQVACLRAAPVGGLLDDFGAGPPFPVRLTPTLPVEPGQAIADGDFARVPVVVGFNRDEGRTFARGLIGATQDQYVAFVRATFPTNADQVLVRYPWPAVSDRFTAAYLAADIMTDSGLVLGVGVCPGLGLVRDLSAHVRTYAYRFDARSGPGPSPVPGYAWGAGHAAELPYLFPGFSLFQAPAFTLTLPVTPQFDAGERRLATDMKRYWGAFVATGAPDVRGLARWPRFDSTGAVLSLRPGGRSAAITQAQLRREHQCGFWDRQPPFPQVAGSPSLGTVAGAV